MLLTVEPGLDIPEVLLDLHQLPTRRDVVDTFGIDKSDREAKRRWGEFSRFAEPEQYEILTVEFIEALGGYFLERTCDNPTDILEVGAGNGRLAHFLNQYFDGKTGVRVMPTDSGEEDIEPLFPVEVIRHIDALAKYEPAIVLFSWMPYGLDLTEGFRRSIGLQEYVLIGEVDFGCCGNHATWGVEMTDDDQITSPHPKYEQDGFTRHAVDEVSRHQMCRTDGLNHFSHSKTVSFRRK